MNHCGATSSLKLRKCHLPDLSPEEAKFSKLIQIILKNQLLF